MKIERKTEITKEKKLVEVETEVRTPVVILTLTPEEADLLKKLLSCIGGSPEGFTSPAFTPLNINVISMTQDVQQKIRTRIVDTFFYKLSSS